MADPKETRLSIVIRTVDQATAKLKAINDRLDKVAKPFKDFKEQLSDLGDKTGLNSVIEGFKGVGGAITDLLGKVAMIGGVAGVAVAGLLQIIDGFDELGDKAEAIGVSVGFLAQMRYAAEQSGASVESLDAGLKGFSVSLGLARTGAGKMASFLKSEVQGPLLKQLQATKSNEEAFDLLVRAMEKIEDPAKRAAFAQKTLGDASLAPLLNQGADGIKKLREEYAKANPNVGEAAAKAGEVDTAMKNLKASTDGIKAALVIGLGPAIEKIVKKLSDWLVGHRADIEAWAKSIGEKLPGAIEKVIKWVQKAWDKVTGFVDAVGGLKNVAIGVAAIIAGPVVVSVFKLIAALVTAIARVASLRKGLADVNTGTGGGGGAAGGGAASKAGGAAGAIPVVGQVVVAASMLNDLTGGSIGGEGPGAMSQLDIAKQLLMQRPEFAARTSRWQQFLGMPATKPSEAKVTLDIKNAPPGSRVTTDPKSTADVDLLVGYQMAGAM